MHCCWPKDVNVCFCCNSCVINTNLDNFVLSAFSSALLSVNTDSRQSHLRAVGLSSCIRWQVNVPPHYYFSSTGIWWCFVFVDEEYVSLVLHFISSSRKSLERVDLHPYLKASHINHQVITSLVFVFTRLNNSWEYWRESSPNNVFIVQVPSTESPAFFIQCQQLTPCQSQLQCQCQLLKLFVFQIEYFIYKRKHQIMSNNRGLAALHQL